MDFMTKLETNALRIAELIGLPTTPSNTFVFEYYDGLMPIVFECNKSDSVIKFNKHYVEFWYLGDNEVPHYNDYRSNHIINEPEFIEALQLACIKYLELRNAYSRVQPTV